MNWHAASHLRANVAAAAQCSPKALAVAEAVLSTSEFAWAPYVRIQPSVVCVEWATLGFQVSDLGGLTVTHPPAQAGPVTLSALCTLIRVLVPSKHQTLRERLQVTLNMLQQRDRYNPTHDPAFDEASYPSYLFLPNVAVHCEPLNPAYLDRLRVQGWTLEQIQREVEAMESGPRLSGS